MFIKNCWYVAGWTNEVADDNFLKRTIINIPLAIWRKKSGDVVVFEDLCCHRGAPLSAGRREGDCVRCMYHGLKFDENGICVEIPGQPNISSNDKVRTFPVVERSKWIWVWMGDSSKADESLIPDTHWLDDIEWRSLQGYTHYDANYLLIADNLLDLAHLPYVHPKTLGGSEDFAKSRPKIKMLSRGVNVNRWTLNTSAPAFVQKVMPFHGKVDRWNHYDFLLPGIFVMDSGMLETGKGAVEGNRRGAAMFHGCQALTPETEKSTHYFFGHPHNFSINNPDVTRSIHQSVVDAFEEDRAMVSLQSDNLSLRADFKMRPIRADEALGRFRWLVAKTIKEETTEPSTDSKPFTGVPA